MTPDPVRSRHQRAANWRPDPPRGRPGALYQAILQLWFRRPDGSAPRPLTDPPDEATGVMQGTREGTIAFLVGVVVRHWDGVCECQAAQATYPDERVDLARETTRLAREALAAERDHEQFTRRCVAALRSLVLWCDDDRQRVNALADRIERGEC